MERLRGRFYHALLQGVGRLENVIAYDNRTCSPEEFKQDLKISFIGFPQLCWRDKENSVRLSSSFAHAENVGFLPLVSEDEFVHGKLLGIKPLLEKEGGFEALTGGKIFPDELLTGFDVDQFIEAKVNYNKRRIDDFAEECEDYGIPKDYTTIFPEPSFWEVPVKGGVIDKLEPWPWGLRVVDFKTRLPGNDFLPEVKKRMYDYVAGLKKAGKSVYEHEFTLTTIKKGDDFCFEDHVFKVPVDEIARRLK
ncbi:MAG: hypothetical protein GOU97_03670 [Nanoarchaeota archaeon]|nr:hypothetical protein [Nanoarchaeota archaeon]